MTLFGTNKIVFFILIGVVIALIYGGDVAHASPTPIDIPNTDKMNNTKGRPWPYKPAGPSAPVDPHHIKQPKRHSEVPWIIGGTLGGAFVIVFIGFVVHYVRKKSELQTALLSDGPTDYHTSFSSSGQMISIVPAVNDMSRSPGWGSFPHRIHPDDPESPQSPYKGADAEYGRVPASGTLGDPSESSALYQPHL